MKRTLLLFCILLVTLFAEAQSWPEKVLLDWQSLKTEEIAENKIVTYLYFTESHLHQVGEKLMPVWHFQLPRKQGQNLQLNMGNTVWEQLSNEELSSLPLDYLDTLSSLLNVRYGTTRHRDFAEIVVVPFRKNQGRYERLRSFSLSGQWSEMAQPMAFRQKSYAAHSLLASGDIYKVSLSKTGIYKLTYQVMNQLGVPMNNLSLYRIAIYGNGGALMPENTHDAVYDDLEEIPVKVVDENGNGLFDEEDYLLFYGQGIVSWNYSSGTMFEHTLNYFSDYAYYFIKINETPSKTLNKLPSDSRTATHVQTTFNFRTVMEQDLINVNECGRIWLQDQFDAITSQNYKFSLPALEAGEKAQMVLRMAVSSPSSSSYFSYKASGGSLATANFSATGGALKSVLYTFEPSSSQITLDLNYSKPLNSSKAWLDYVTINLVCKLRQTNSQMDFRCLSSVGAGNITEYRIDAQNHNLTIWDVTDPCNYQEVQYVMDNGAASFRLSSDTLREFVSFYGSDFYTVSPVGKVTSQDLHASNTADLVIVTSPSFLSVANEWADFRRQNDGISVLVVTTEQIYNEFGSGKQDIAAIRNFLRMLYDRYGTQAPKNVMLLGKVSYDFRNRKQMNTNYIPNYQGERIFSKEDCLSTDDFFVKLDDYEGLANSGSMDMGIGRIPVTSVSQAKTMLQKMKMYASKEPVSTSQSRGSNMGDWRNVIVFCADDDADGQGHLFNADRIAQVVSSNYPVYNLEKIYMDAYKKVSTSQGQRYPDATDAINQRVNNGCLLFSYMGHGGDNGWAHERVLRRSDINSWTNRYALPFFYAGSCSFGEYDKLSALSPSEDMIFKSDGGAIGVISASRSSYGGTNEYFGIHLHKNALNRDSNGRYLTMGEVFSKAKNNCGSVQMYILFGDPSMTLAFPEIRVRTDSINGNAFNVCKDTMKALSYLRVNGSILRSDGSLADDFNGYVFPNVFDKVSTVTTLLNNSNSVEKTFQLQKSSLFKGKVAVKNGRFQFTFLAPKDLNYDIGYGKISYYTFGNQTDATGFDSVIVGGLSDTLINDEKGPDITLYLNSESFVNGGITTANPTLLAEISDESGINAAGTGIGHDIVAILDNDESNRILLNDYYECDENSSVSGKISYLLSDIAEGNHTLTVRAWDVLNNRGEASVSFSVVNDKEIQLSHVLNYPNPFTTHTQFYFEHNQLNTDLNIRIQIFTISGKLVKTINETAYQTQSYRYGPIEWDGRDDYGGKLAKGTYIYKLTVRNSTKKIAEKIEKLVIL